MAGRAPRKTETMTIRSAINGIDALTLSRMVFSELLRSFRFNLPRTITRK